MVETKDTLKGTLAGTAKAAGQAVRGRGSIYTTLAKEHGMVDAMLKELVGTSKSDKSRREELLATIKKNLLEHAKNEDAFFYSALENNPETKDRIAQFRKEHAEVEAMLEELSNMPADDDAWLDKARSLKTNVEAHVKEEEKGLFPDADSILSSADARAIDAKHVTRSAEA